MDAQEAQWLAEQHAYRWREEWRASATMVASCSGAVGRQELVRQDVG